MMDTNNNSGAGRVNPEEDNIQKSGIQDNKRIQSGRIESQIRIKLPDGEYNLKHLLDEVLRARGVNDQFTKSILRSLVEIREIHKELKEWKELHNHLNDILVKSGEVKIRLLRMQAEKVQVQDYDSWRSDLRIKWSSCKTHTEELLDWLLNIQYIEDEPFQIDEKGDMKGPRWAINIQNAHNDIMKFLSGEEKINQRKVIEDFLIFIGLIETRMTQADKSLRETAGALNDKSEVVLGSIGDVQV